MKKLAAGTVVVFLMVAGFGLPAEALDQGSMGTMSPDNTHVRKDFPPIPGLYPQRQAHFFAGYRPFGCATSNYCDRITFNMQFPENLTESFRGTDIVGFGVKITLTWPNHKENDLDLFIWPNDSPAFGGPQGVCGSPEDRNCNKLYPEIFNVVDPLKPEDDPETEENETEAPITIFMSVVNHTGINTGYTIDLQWFLIPFGSFPDFKPPKGGSVTRQVTAAQAPQPFSPAGKQGGGTTRTKILIPGPDGQLIEQDLEFFAAGHRFREARSGTSTWVWIVSGGILALALVVFAYLVYQRRRREALT